MSELKNCPFCGSTNIVEGVYSYNCDSCHSWGPALNELSKGINAKMDLWNTRQPDPRVAELEKVRDDFMAVTKLAIEGFGDDSHLRRFPAIFALMENAMKKSEATKGKVGE